MICNSSQLLQWSSIWQNIASHKIMNPSFSKIYMLVWPYIYFIKRRTRKYILEQVSRKCYTTRQTHDWSDSRIHHTNWIRIRAPLNRSIKNFRNQFNVIKNNWMTELHSIFPYRATFFPRLKGGSYKKNKIGLSVSLFVCLCRVKGQKNIFLKTDFFIVLMPLDGWSSVTCVSGILPGSKEHFHKNWIFRFFKRNGETSKIFEFREKWGQKNILLNIADSEIYFLCEVLLR